MTMVCAAPESELGQGIVAFIRNRLRLELQVMVAVRHRGSDLAGPRAWNDILRLIVRYEANMQSEPE